MLKKINNSKIITSSIFYYLTDYIFLPIGKTIQFNKLYTQFN